MHGTESLWNIMWKSNRLNRNEDPHCKHDKHYIYNLKVKNVYTPIISHLSITGQLIIKFMKYERIMHFGETLVVWSLSYQHGVSAHTTLADWMFFFFLFFCTIVCEQDITRFWNQPSSLPQHEITFLFILVFHVKIYWRPASAWFNALLHDWQVR